MGTRPSAYRRSILWIAQNDDAGSDDALDARVVAGYVSTCLVADVFGTTTTLVALRVVEIRKELAANNQLRPSSVSVSCDWIEYTRIRRERLYYRRLAYAAGFVMLIEALIIANYIHALSHISYVY